MLTFENINNLKNIQRSAEVINIFIIYFRKVSKSGIRYRILKKIIWIMNIWELFYRETEKKYR
jgi:hypothetical protein